MILRNHGIPLEIVDLINRMYDGTCCRIVQEGQLSESFVINTGVRQGCLKSPFLFILGVDWLMREATKGKKMGIQWMPWMQLQDLDFADDLTLLSNTQEQMQSKTQAIDTLSKTLGLSIHPGKSKVFRVRCPSNEQVVIRGQVLEELESFCYLGSGIDGDGGTAGDIKAKFVKAQAAFGTLNKFRNCKNVLLRTKIRIFNSNVKSVLLYGCETWNASQNCIRKVQVFIFSCLRKLLKIKWRDMIRNEEL